jgi:Undecaprenyl-phosphate galactose phosphotransferase WbaP
MSSAKPISQPETSSTFVDESLESNSSPLQLAVQRWTYRRRWHYFSQNLKSALPLWLSDVASIVVCMALCLATLQLLQLHPSLTASLWLITAQVVISTFALFLLKLYPGVGLHPVIELRQSAYAIILSFGCSMIGLLLSEQASSKQLYLLLLSGPMALVVLPTMRQYSRQLLARTQWWCQPVIIFADQVHAQNLWYHLARQPELGWKPISLIASHSQPEETNGSLDIEIPDAMVLRSTKELERIAYGRHVFCGILDQNTGRHPELLEELHATLPRLVTVVSQSEAPALWVEGTECAGLPCICYHRSLEHPFQRITKRCFDVLVSGTLLLFLLPIFMTAGIALKLTTRGTIFFSHFRTGRFGKQFRIWKFRSMVTNSDELLQKYLAEHPELDEEWQKSIKLENDPRITPVGRILRKTSIDELPQLWNVFIGNMSLVGPRPILNEEVAKYGSTYPLYAQVRHGMTGLWQVSGRNNTSYEKRLHYVSYYVRNWSLWLDWYIVLKTFRVVVSADGAS